MSNKISLLYVDDDLVNRELFEINFEDKYKLYFAEHGNEGLDILENNKEISIVISDMKMPQMNGVEFIKIAKNKFPVIKYYILTGFEVNVEIQKALNDGLILKCFSKPFNFLEIESSISNKN